MYLYLYTIHLVSTAYFILGLFIRCSDKQTNILLDINCVTITKLEWNQLSVSRGRNLPFYRIAPCLIMSKLLLVLTRATFTHFVEVPSSIVSHQHQHQEIIDLFATDKSYCFVPTSPVLQFCRLNKHLCVPSLVEPDICNTYAHAHFFSMLDYVLALFCPLLPVY